MIELETKLTQAQEIFNTMQAQLKELGFILAATNVIEDHKSIVTLKPKIILEKLA
jgi:hypothetical protein